MSLNSDVKLPGFKCKITTLHDPTKYGSAWVKEVATMARILGVSDTIKLQYTAVEVTDISDTDEEDYGEVSKSSGLDKITKVKIEEHSEEEIEKVRGVVASPPRSEPPKGTESVSSFRKGSKSSVTESESTKISPEQKKAPSTDERVDQLSKQLEDLKNLLLQQKLPEGYITSTRRENTSGTKGQRESWLAESLVQRAFGYATKWRNPKTLKIESDDKYRKRMILNVAMKESLRKFPEFYRSELEGDNYKIVRNVLIFGEPNSNHMKISLNRKLSVHVKTKEMPYMEYETKLRNMWEQLACMGKVVSEEDKTLQLITGMQNDPRYADVVKDVCNSGSNYAQSHAAFMQEASENNDLWSLQKRSRGGNQGDISATEKPRPRPRGRDRDRNKDKNRGGKQEKFTAQQKKNCCTFFLAHNYCRNGDRCRNPHISLEQFQAKARDKEDDKDERKVPRKRDKDKKIPVCFHWKNEGSCRFANKCRYRHDNHEQGKDGSIEMTRDELSKGDYIKVINVPKCSLFFKAHGLIIGKRGERFLIEPNTGMSRKGKVYLKSTGLLSRNIAAVPKPEAKGKAYTAMSADRIADYEFRAAFDPAADITIVPSEEMLVKGSVKDLKRPIRLTGFQDGGEVVEFKRAGLLCLKSNTGMEGHLAITAYISPRARRALVAQAQLDEMGWYLEVGGGAARMRRGGSQSNFIVLARFEETINGIPVLDVTQEMRSGEQDLRHKLGKKGGSKYPIPDELFVTNIGEINSLDDADKPIIVRSKINNYAHDGEINLAQRYSQQERLELMHQIMGHTNYMRLALMAHWDGTGPKPSQHVLAKACAVCAIAKAHALPRRQLSYEFKDDTLLGHVYADLSTDMGTSIEGYKHFLSIYAQGGFKHFAFCLRTRAEANQWLIVWMRRTHTQHYPLKIKFLHVDNELVTNKIKQECMDNGTQLIVNQRSAHEQNAKGERPIRSITEIMRAVLLQGGAHRHAFWPIGVHNAIEVLGYLPPMRKLRSKPKGKDKGERPLTPNEIWYGNNYPTYKEQMRNLVTPFCEVTAIADDLAVRGGKTHNPGIPAMYLGPVLKNDMMKRAHVVVRYDNGKRMLTRHVIPNSDRFPLIHGPSPGLKMHPSIMDSNKTENKDGDLELNLQEKGFDPDQHNIVEWEGEEASREARHNAVNERLRLATGQDHEDNSQLQVTEIAEDKELNDSDEKQLAQHDQDGHEDENKEVTTPSDNVTESKNDLNEIEEPEEEIKVATQENSTQVQTDQEDITVISQDQHENKHEHIHEYEHEDSMEADMPPLEDNTDFQQDLKEAWEESQHEAEASNSPFTTYNQDKEVETKRDEAEECDESKYENGSPSVNIQETQERPPERAHNASEQAHDKQESNDKSNKDASESQVSAKIASEQTQKSKSSKSKQNKVVGKAKRTPKAPTKAKIKPKEKKKPGKSIISKEKPAKSVQKKVRFNPEEIAERRSKRTRHSKAFMARTPQEMYPPGTIVMSRWGPAVVKRVLANGLEADLTWPNYDKPDAVYNTKLEHFWLPEEKPGVEYDLTGAMVTKKEINATELTSETKFRGYDIDDLKGNVKARDINLSLPRHRHQI